MNPLRMLNDELSGKFVLLGNGLKPSEAGLIVFSRVHPSLISLPDTNKEKLSHVLRKVDSFNRWFTKVLCEVDDLNMQSSSDISWSTD
ncbi:unnamed protein product [Lathyrus oleraceus]|uniref:Uncharacterized protein n=1 Tax=Pisum sativum TaxID=3888 RepID=A0A9D5BNK5_PEA|nr:hypothetical protein KIW84_014617 [Pisum sativum]